MRMCFILVLLLITSCTILPSSTTTDGSVWNTFNDIKQTYDHVVEGVTTPSDLHNDGFNPNTSGNVTILSYIELQQHFLPNSAIQFENLHPTLQQCLRNYTQCFGYQINVENSRSKRVGNPLLDIFMFRRTTITTSWKFKGLFIIDTVDGQPTIVYKLWEGKPSSEVTTTERRPLGFLDFSTVRQVMP